MAPKTSAHQTRASKGLNSPSTDTQDQILLKALQDLIIRVVAPKRTNDTNPITLGPEAGKLITALQEFVASIIKRSKSMTGEDTVIEVSLVEEGNTLQSEDNGRAALTPASSATNQGDINKDHDSRHPASNSLENPQPTFQDKLLKGLREHVFNMMPIRMLSFEPHGPTLRISLLERGAIYARLASALQRKWQEIDHAPVYSEDLRRMENEDEAIARLTARYGRYAILSHTWLRTSPEVTYGDWTAGAFDARDLGYQKLVNFGRVAWNNHELTLGWMDTICINKESSSELDESIRSMYNWYSRAAVCITYLAETAALSRMHIDPWFTRGWTLQELLAPHFIKFYNNDWKPLLNNSANDKTDANIAAQIERATTISKYELVPVREVPIWRKMQLAAGREVTREEDAAYSLMGIFSVSISTAYGEGAQRSFFRLLEAILASSVDVLDIFNWAGDLPVSDSPACPSSFLPSSPLHYRNSYRFISSLGRPADPLTLTHLGLRVPVILMPATWFETPEEASKYVPLGDYSATVNISTVGMDLNAPKGTYNLLDKRILREDGRRDKGFFTSSGPFQLTLAVFNFFGGEASTSVFLNPTCIAKVLYCDHESNKVTSLERLRVIHTNMPVVFDLQKTTMAKASYERQYRINRNELVKHGMKFVSLYL